MNIVFYIIAAFILVLLVIRIVFIKSIKTRCKPNEKDILVKLIACHSLAENHPFLSEEQIQSIHNDGYLITDKEAINITAAALFRILIFSHDKFWNDSGITDVTLRKIKQFFPQEWEILSAMFKFEMENQYNFRTLDDAIKHTSGWIATALILTPGAASRSIAQTFYSRLYKSRVF